MTSVLTLNGGSSTLRFALYTVEPALHEVLRGKVERIGLPDSNFTISDAKGQIAQRHHVAVPDHAVAISCLLEWLGTRYPSLSIRAIGHRVVHGMMHSAPQRITPALMADLRRITAFDPEHLPSELALIEAVRSKYPDTLQVACFDTAFHRSMPPVARLLPIPQRYRTAGVERYGFHGLSYAYLLEELSRLGDPAAKQGRVILAHLGNGASMAAVRDGRSIDTSMGFTPAAGLVMSTRAGDLDPGLSYYLMKDGQLSVEQFQHMVNHESGLLGVSGLSSDMRDLLAHETSNAHAAQAIELFCYQAKKWLGAFAAVLGGLDTLVFAGGIGENSAPVRARICAELGFLGINLDVTRNADHAGIISTDNSAVTVRVIHTNEELMIARSVCRLLGFTPEQH